jgi:hypothetical protein
MERLKHAGETLEKTLYCKHKQHPDKTLATYM